LPSRDAGAGDPAATSAAHATLFTICGNLSLRAGELAKGRTLLESALALWQEMFGPTDCQVAATTLDLAFAHRLAGRYELSEQHARRALGIYETSCAPRNLALHQTLISLSAAEIMLGRYAEAESNLSRALSVLGPAPEREGPEAAAVFSNLGLLYLKQGRYFDAERSYRRATAIQDNGLDFARNLASLASVYVATGRYDKAEAACSQALPLLTGFHGPDHAEGCRHSPDPGASAAGSTPLRRSGGPAAAGPRYRAAGAGSGSSERVDRADQHRCVLRSGGALCPSRRAAAKSDLDPGKAGQRRPQRLFGDPSQTLALACNKQGRHAEALQLASRALAVREGDLPGLDASLIEIMLHNAELLRKAHRKTEAAQLERTVRQARAGRGNEDPRQWTVDFRELQRKN